MSDAMEIALAGITGAAIGGAFSYGSSVSYTSPRVEVEFKEAPRKKTGGVF